MSNNKVHSATGQLATCRATWFDKREIVVPVLTAIYGLLTYFPADTAKELVTSQDFSVVNKNNYAIY